MPEYENIKEEKSVLIGKILFWALFVLGIIVFLWALLGNSPTLEQALLIFILGMVIKNSFSISGINTKTELTKQKLENLENKFNSLASDFKGHTKHK